MEKEKLLQIINECSKNESNIITKDIALDSTQIGKTMYNLPLVGFSSSRDSIYTEFKKSSIIGKNHLLPTDLLSEAKTVISLFFPFTKQIKESNIGGSEPSNSWMHARIDGQSYINQVTKDIVKAIESSGESAIIPYISGKTKTFYENHEYSNWSERHVAYASGLGTFGLSKGLITSKGIAGRFISIVTSLEITPSKREYSSYNEYCNMCGNCITNCPANAISTSEKSNHTCDIHVSAILEKNRPYYGCGKCQVDVMCENGIPEKIEEN